jgi:preprotein translocase subunit YajC
MNLFTVLLQEGTASSTGGGGNMMWIMLIAMFAIMYFFMIRPQQKKQKAIAKFRNSLQVNQDVVTAGGIHGKIKEIKDNCVILEIAANVKISVEKSSVFAAASDVPAQK